MKERLDPKVRANIVKALEKTAGSVAADGKVEERREAVEKAMNGQKTEEAKVFNGLSATRRGILLGEAIKGVRGRKAKAEPAKS